MSKIKEIKNNLSQYGKKITLLTLLSLLALNMGCSKKAESSNDFLSNLLSQQAVEESAFEKEAQERASKIAGNCEVNISENTGNILGKYKYVDGSAEIPFQGNVLNISDGSSITINSAVYGSTNIANNSYSYVPTNAGKNKITLNGTYSNGGRSKDITKPIECMAIDSNVFTNSVSSENEFYLDDTIDITSKLKSTLDQNYKDSLSYSYISNTGIISISNPASFQVTQAILDSIPGGERITILAKLDKTKLTTGIASNSFTDNGTSIFDINIKPTYADTCTITMNAGNTKTTTQFLSELVDKKCIVNDDNNISLANLSVDSKFTLAGDNITANATASPTTGVVTFDIVNGKYTDLTSKTKTINIIVQDDIPNMAIACDSNYFYNAFDNKGCVINVGTTSPEVQTIVSGNVKFYCGATQQGATFNLGPTHFTANTSTSISNSRLSINRGYLDATTNCTNGKAVLSITDGGGNTYTAETTADKNLKGKLFTEDTASVLNNTGIGSDKGTTFFDMSVGKNASSNGNLCVITGDGGGAINITCKDLDNNNQTTVNTYTTGESNYAMMINGNNDKFIASTLNNGGGSSVNKMFYGSVPTSTTVGSITDFVPMIAMKDDNSKVIISSGALDTSANVHQCNADLSSCSSKAMTMPEDINPNFWRTKPIIIGNNIYITSGTKLYVGDLSAGSVTFTALYTYTTPMTPSSDNPISMFKITPDGTNPIIIVSNGTNHYAYLPATNAYNNNSITQSVDNTSNRISDFSLSNTWLSANTLNQIIALTYGNPGTIKQLKLF